jgi:hypothetical protein
MACLSARDLATLLDSVRAVHDAAPRVLPGRCICAMQTLIGAERGERTLKAEYGTAAVVVRHTVRSPRR